MVGKFLVRKLTPHQNPCLIDSYAWMASFILNAIITTHEETISLPRVVNTKRLPVRLEFNNAIHNIYSQDMRFVFCKIIQ